MKWGRWRERRRRGRILGDIQMRDAPSKMTNASVAPFKVIKKKNEIRPDELICTVQFAETLPDE